MNKELPDEVFINDYSILFNRGCVLYWQINKAGYTSKHQYYKNIVYNRNWDYNWLYWRGNWVEKFFTAYTGKEIFYYFFFHNRWLNLGSMAYAALYKWYIICFSIYNIYYLCFNYIGIHIKRHQI